MDETILIAVLMGGPGSERDVSLASGKAVLEALLGEGLQAVGVDVVDTTPTLPEGTGLVFNVIHGTFGEDGGLQSYLEGLGVPYTGGGVEDSRVAFDKALSKKVFLENGVPTPHSELLDVVDTTPTLPEGTGLVFNVIHGTFGEDGGLQSYLEGLGVPYTGGGVEDSRVAFDKALSKEVFLEKGVPTPHSELLDVSGGAQLPSIPVPFVVKPPREGSSVGIEIVKEAGEALAAIERGAKFSDDLLIEEFVEGRELTVGVLDGEVLPVVEIIPPDGGSYDFATKYTWLSGQKNASNYLCPAELSPEETAAVQAAALKAHESLQIGVYSRVDVLLNSLSKPYVLEANTIPGMTASSLLPMGAKAAGYSFGGLCRRIAELSWQKRGAKA